LADAIVHTGAEGHESTLVDDGFWALVGPALGHKIEWFSKVARITLDAVDGHPYYDVTGDVGSVREGDAFWWGFALHAGWNLCGVSDFEQSVIAMEDLQQDGDGELR
jgi:hypothetical protein